MSELTSRYAEAILSIAKENKKINSLYEEINSFCCVLDENNGLVRYFGSFKIEPIEKHKFIDDKLQVYSEELLNFIHVIVKNGRSNIIDKIFNESRKVFEDELDIERGTVYSALPLDEKEIKKLIDGIARKTGKRVVLKNLIDETLIGGVKVVLRSEVYDASIKTKIDNMKDLLLKGGN